MQKPFDWSLSLLWDEFYSPKNLCRSPNPHYLNNVTVTGDWGFQEVIKFKRGH